MSSSSLEYSSMISDPSTSVSLSDDDISNSNPDLAEVQMLTRMQTIQSKKYQKELLQSERRSKKWAKTQVDTVAAIKDAELMAKQYEFERLQAEFNTELANKEVEIDSEMREIDAECGDLRIQVQQLEIELGEVKDSRKRNLLAVRSQIQAALREMEQKEVAHAKQINQLQTALASVIEKHKKDIYLMRDEAATSDQVIEIEIQRLSQDIERYRRNMSKSDQTQGRRMTEAGQTIEMLKNEIQSSYERTKVLRDEFEDSQIHLLKLQQDLIKIEEYSQILHEQLTTAEDHKMQMKNELAKLDRAVWNGRKTYLLRSD
ncbi:hypothetical protein TRFO_12120 [Tritrichomonas foetus]|uniref:Uncharacterized protein n=1 Tax=Tritrichomonas foetus TaxID=1144522 RepID=A0A1J4J019_9EUKA|nr:hypothetical protein [Tritrichomonas foetus]OHS92944.1 hypothetical protein TRFO_12120 [Tritrichomonas foetus]|eukprot:OHS92944.1 hypothetical protein TRFO_12120 [Tritrichomonas foetus]